MRVGGWICALATQLMTAIDKTMIKPPTCRFITAPFLNSTYHLFRGAITKSAVLPNARHTKSQFDRTLKSIGLFLRGWFQSYSGRDRGLADQRFAADYEMKGGWFYESERNRNEIATDHQLSLIHISEP